MKEKMVEMVLLMRVNSLSIALTTAAAKMFGNLVKNKSFFLRNDVNADIKLRVVKIFI